MLTFNMLFYTISIPEIMKTTEDKEVIILFPLELSISYCKIDKLLYPTTCMYKQTNVRYSVEVYYFLPYVNKILNTRK